MKSKKVLTELRSLEAADLSEQLVLMRKELLSLKLQRHTSHVKDYSRFSKLRKLVAQIHTVLRQKTYD